MTENGEQRDPNTPVGSPGFSGAGLSPPRGPLSFLADVVAGIRVSVHVKLLSGYFVGASLVLGMAILIVVVISNMNHQVSELSRFQNQVQSAAKKQNLVSSQLHSMALALLTGDESEFARSEEAKRRFSEVLVLAESKSTGEQAESFQNIREANDRFVAAGTKGLAQSGNPEEAIRIHVEEERPLSVEVQRLLTVLAEDANAQMEVAQSGFQSDRKLLSTVGWTLSGISLAAALLIGFVMSLAFIRPVRRIDSALAQIAVGDFSQRVYVPNRDEFGTLSQNLTHISHMAEYPSE